MAPHPGEEADYIRDKARKSLLNLLEGVSLTHLSLMKTAAHVTMNTGSGEEESGYWQGVGRPCWPLCQILYSSRVWRGSSIPA
jgi:hypothetical protein